MNVSHTPKVSVIIASLNCVDNLQTAIASVVSQTYRNMELVIVDGGSTDGTIRIIKNYEVGIKNKEHNNRINFKWISKKDKGISDAFNKGIAMADGDYMYFLGASDILKNSQVIEHMMEKANPKTDMILCGRVERIKNTKKYSVVYTYSLHFAPWMLIYKMGLPHQGMFMNKRFFKKYGLFDTHLKYAMDYDLLLRAYHDFPKVVLKNIIVAGWREGGVGKNKLQEILDEYHLIRKKNHIASIWMLEIIYLLIKIRYWAFTL